MKLLLLVTICITIALTEFMFGLGLHDSWSSDVPPLEIVKESPQPSTNEPEAPEKTVEVPPAAEPETPDPRVADEPAADFGTLLEAELHREINVVRADHDLPLLSRDATLASVARAHSADMLARDYFEHDDPEGCGSDCRATNAGYQWRAVGENIFTVEGYPLEPETMAKLMVSGWMESPGHRRNMLDEEFTEEGVGIAYEGDVVYATQMLASPR